MASVFNFLYPAVYTMYKKNHPLQILRFKLIDIIKLAAKILTDFL